MGNHPRDTGQRVAFRTIMVDVQVIAPTEGALADWEREIRDRVRRTVNNQSAAKRHGVSVRAPGVPGTKPRDADFFVITTAMPSSRRGGRRHG